MPSGDVIDKTFKHLTGLEKLQNAANMAATDLKDIIDDGTRTYSGAYDTYNKSKEEFEKIKKGFSNGSTKPVNVTEGITFKEVGKAMAENGSKIVSDTAKAISEETKNIFKNAIAGIGKELSKVFFNPDFLVYDRTLTEYRVFKNKLLHTVKNRRNYKTFYMMYTSLGWLYYEKNDFITANKLIDPAFNNEDFMKGWRFGSTSGYRTDYDTFNFSSDPKTGEKVKKSWGQNMKDKTVRHILLSGADFLPHFYDVALYQYNDGFEHVYKSGDILDPRGFAVRLGKISVTPSRNDSFNLGIGERIIPKVRSSKVIPKTGTFSFRLDKYLLWLESFNQAAGIGNTYNREIYRPYLEYDNVMATRSYVGNGSNAHSKKVCLLCSKISLLGLRNPFTTIVNFSREDHQPREWGYMFEDVRFAGTQDAINYSADVSGPQDITVTFTYKRVRKVFYYDKEYWSLSSYGY